jgi:hypothetical protein
VEQNRHTLEGLKKTADEQKKKEAAKNAVKVLSGIQNRHTFEVLKNEYGIVAVRCPGGIPQKLSEALKQYESRHFI